jgi:type II secretory pathway pseudopilin PulG
MADDTHQSRSTRRESGFTLLELAIVHAVIALILGSVLLGSAIASQARLRSLTKDHAGLITAIHVYRYRYAALPGDDPNASTRWPNARNGTGDGVIGGWYDDAPPADPSTMAVDATTGETLLFWWHLRLAGLIQGPTSGPGAVAPPTGPTAGRIGVQDASMGLAGLALCMDGVTPKLASELEIQIDDGNANTGVVRARVLAPDGSATDLPNGHYQETGTDVYVMCMSLASGSGFATDNGSNNGNGSSKGNGNAKGNGKGIGNGNGKGSGNGNGNGNGKGQ